MTRAFYKGLFLGTTASLLLVSACGKRSGGKSDDANRNVPTIELENLTPEQELQFEAWKSSLIKECSFEAAFPFLKPNLASKENSSPENQDLFIDHKVLGKLLGGSSLILGENEEIAILGEPSSPNGQSISSRSFSQNVNGQSSSVAVSADRNGSSCVVTFNGQKVYETQLSAHYPVDLFFDAHTATELMKSNRMMVTAFDFTSQTDAELTQVQVANLGPLAQYILGGMEHFDRMHPFLAKKLGSDIEKIRPYFQGGRVPTSASMRLVDRATTPFALDGLEAGHTLSALGGLSDLISTAPSTLKIEFLVRLSNQFDPTPHQRLHRFQADWKWEEKTITAEGEFKKQIVSMGSLTDFAFVDYIESSDEVARNCFLQRADLMTAFSRRVMKRAQSLFDDVGRPCIALSPSFSKLMTRDMDIQRAIVSRAVGRGLQPSTNYYNWDSAYIALAQNVFAAGQDLSVLLGFDMAESVKSQVELAFAGFLNLREAVKLNQSMDEVLSPKLLTMTLSWMFRSLVPQPELIDNIKSTLVHAGPDFSSSLMEMLKDLQVDPSATSAGAKAALCGAALQAEKRSALVSVLVKSLELIGLKEWSEASRNRALQNCWSQESINSLTLTADLLTRLQQEESTAQTDRLYLLSAEKVAKMAISERWTDSAFESFRALAQYIQVSNRFSFCAQKPTVTQTFTCATDTGLNSAHGGNGGMLAGVYKSRYAALAQDLTIAQKEWLSHPRVFNLRYALEEAFFGQPGAMWSRCNDEVFASNKSRLLGLMNQRRTATDFNSGYQIEQTIKTLLQDCP